MSPVTEGQPSSSSEAFDERLARLDLSLFAAIPSQSTDGDRRSLLACQLAVRRRVSRYVYLEIGSHLGGSLQPHVQDPACGELHSIDTRPTVQPDARGVPFAYPDNSTERMLSGLARLDPTVRARVRCYDAPTRTLDPDRITAAPHLCFIDGEHTDAAATADFAFCRRVLAPSGLILFHDASVIYNALWQIVEDLDRSGVSYRACALPDVIFAVEFGTWNLLDGPELAPVRRESFRGYLFSLRANDPYRRLAHRWPLRAYRKLRAITTLWARR
jgi:hypothetical protein